LAASYSKGSIIINFLYTGVQLRTSDQQAAKGFSIDGKTEIDAIIKNNQVIIEVKEKPGFVYYGWQPYSKGNLINSDNLPASTFKMAVE
jgi:sialate O-acetylesterase